MLRIRIFMKKLKSRIRVDALELNWATGVTGTETFNISNPNSGVAGPDFVGYLFTDNNDPDYGDDYYWALCYPSDFSGYSAVVSTYAIQAFTNYNPNTIISAVVNGSSQLTNSEPAQSTDLRIYRSPGGRGLPQRQRDGG